MHYKMPPAKYEYLLLDNYSNDRDHRR